jgi:RimJ/RimL family protein N-acetyltransferase
MFSSLSNGSIVLSRLKSEDAVLIYNALKASIAEISPWLSWLDPNYNLDRADEFINLQINNWDEDIEYTYAIKNTQGEFVGVISLHLFDIQNDVASIGYWINSQCTGNGYCTQAVKLLVKNALKPLNLIRIEIIVAIQNKASQRVAEKAGAIYEGVLKNRIRPKSIATDAKMYAFFNP